MSFLINGQDINDIAALVSSSTYIHPAFYTTSNTSGVIKNWSPTHSSLGPALIRDDASGSRELYPELFDDLTKGKLLINNIAYPIAKVGNYPLALPISSSSWYSSNFYTITNTDNYYNLYVQRTNDLYEAYNIYIRLNNSTSNLYTFSCRSLLIAGVGGGGGGGANTHPFPLFSYNGGGGGAGGGMILWLYIKGYNDTQEHCIARMKVGAGGHNAGNRVFGSSGFIGSFGSPGKPSAGEKTWIEWFIDGNTYHADMGGGGAGHAGSDTKSSGGSAIFWLNSEANSYSEKSIIEDNNIKIRIIKIVNGGRGGGKVQLGDASEFNLSVSEIPTCRVASSNSVTLGYKWDSYTGTSANGPDPSGPGWGGCSLLGRGGYMTWSGKTITLRSPTGYGSGGVGNACLTLTGNYVSGSGGRPGVLRFMY